MSLSLNKSVTNILCARARLTMMAVALLLLCGVATPAQTFRGTILGTVTDSTGAAVSGAKGTVKNSDTGLTREVTTSDDGNYAVPELPIGNYSVTVEKTGFRTGVVSGLRVEVSTERRADVSLQPGELAQKIEVTGDTLPQVESTSNVLGGIIEAKIVTNLPVNGRDYQKLIFLVPGVTGSPDQITDSPGSFGVFSVNGARGRANNFLLDGTDMNDGYRNDPSINEAGVFGTPATILPVDAIAELRVLSNFEPEYGRSAGGIINVVTKSGTNAWHGSALEFFRNNALDARNYFNQVGSPQNPFHNNQFGGSLGGPIIRDRTFFFVDYEGTRETGAESSLACVPAGSASDGSLSPTDASNPVIQNLLALDPWPAPNLSTTGCPNISLGTPFSNRVDSAIVKIDHNFSKDHLLTGRYYFGDSDQSFPLALVGGGLVPGFNTATPTRVQLVSLSYVSVISASLVNEARLGWNRFAEGFFPQDRSFDPSTINLNNVGTGTPNGGNPYNFGLPKISVKGFAPIGADNSTPRQRVDTNWHYIDNVSWKTGAHEIKFGYEFRRTSISQIFNRGFRGFLGFDSLADFLSGTPNPDFFKSRQASGNTNRNTFENSHAFYIQDSFRVKRNFTLNIGVRYDYNGIIDEKKGLFTNVDPTTGFPFAVGAGKLYQPDYNNWGPRVSLAWDLSGRGKTVVRTGYGVFFDAYSQDFFMGHLPFNSVFDPGPAYAGFATSEPISFGTVATDDEGNALPLSAGAPVFPNLSLMNDLFGVDPNIRTPYMQNFNLNFQQELGRQSVVQIGYVGSNGHKLFRFRDINQPTQAQINAYDYRGNGCCVPRRLNDTFFYINWQETSANSNYNALQTSWKITDWHGLNSTLNYTWSHSIDDASDGEDFVANASQPNDSNQPRLEKGNSNFDVRHRVTWNFIYQFPNRKGSRSRLTDGWGLNGIVTYQTGQPFHLNYNFEDDYDGSGGFFGRPDLVGSVTYNHSDPSQFLDLTAFTVPCTLAGGTSAQDCLNGSFHFGSLGRNSLVGPDFRQFDFAVFKDTKITERLNLQLRAEVYNIFNHPNFINPYLPAFIADSAFNGISDGSGGVPLGRSLGHLPLTATGDVGIGYPFLGSGGPRGIQLAAKFTF